MKISSDILNLSESESYVVYTIFTTLFAISGLDTVIDLVSFYIDKKRVTVMNGRRIVIVFFLTVSGINISEAQLSNEVVSKIEILIKQKMSKEDIPGLSIAVVKEGALIWSNGYGMADLENFVPATTTTAYRSASVGKSITATAIMQLVADRKIDLDKPIQTYCPIFPQKKWKVTTRHLLSHTSGIRHYGGPKNDEELNSKVHYKNVTDPLNIFKDDSLLFKPGERYAYSTYGYNVLGCIIEGASGLSYIDYLKKYVFQPAGMKSTRIDNPYEIIPNRARGYQKDELGQIINSEYVDMSNKIPAGGFVTTVEDLAFFAIAFMNCSLVSKEMVVSMTTPQVNNSGEVINYGLGWALLPDDKWYGHREAFHGGGTPQVSGMLYLLPDIQFAVVILMNLENVSDRVALAAQIAKVVLDLK